MGEIRWTLQAADDLESVTDFIALDSPHYASLFAADVLERLADFPLSGNVVWNRSNPETREIVHGNYRILYRAKSGAMEILAICHGARSLDLSKLGQE